MDDAGETRAPPPKQIVRGSPLGAYFADSEPAQRPSDVGVVMPTVLRPQIVRALESVYRQDLKGRIQIAIGVDRTDAKMDLVLGAIDKRPPNVSVLLLRLPYSTSVRHGGVHLALDGGSLRSMLSFMVNARHVAYLDDDNAYRPDHLSSLMAAVKGHAWAASQRMIVDQETGKTLGPDIWDSAGPDKGRFASTGGFVDTNCLLVDKITLSHALSRWASGGKATKSFEADKNFFREIALAPHVLTEKPTVLYNIRRDNVLFRYTQTRQPPFE